MLKEQIKKFFDPPQIIIQSGIDGVEWKFKKGVNPNKSFSYYSIFPHDMNAKLSKEKGVRLLSLNEILNHPELTEKIYNLVLFDTPIEEPFPGNHWRIIDIKPEAGSANLQFCGTFGNYDLEDILPFELPLDIPFFTGVTLTMFRDKDTQEVLPLSAVQILTKEMVESYKTSDGLFYSETIYWTGSAGPILGLFYKYI